MVAKRANVNFVWPSDSRDWKWCVAEWSSCLFIFYGTQIICFARHCSGYGMPFIFYVKSHTQLTLHLLSLQKSLPRLATVPPLLILSVQRRKVVEEVQRKSCTAMKQQALQAFIQAKKASDNSEKCPLQIPKSKDDIFISFVLFEQQVKDIKQKRSTLS